MLLAARPQTIPIQAAARAVTCSTEAREAPGRRSPFDVEFARPVGPAPFPGRTC